MASLSLAMIVKDVEHVVSHALSSVEPFVDEVVVVDTGSSDRTREVVRGFGAKVKLFNFTAETHPGSFMRDVPELFAVPGLPTLEGPWTGKPMLADFAAARNFGWSHCTSDYVLWIDSDDVLVGGEKLKEIVEQMAARRLDTAFLWYEYGYGDLGQCVCKLARERILKRSDDVKWINPVHEAIGPAKSAHMFEDGIWVEHRHQAATAPSSVTHRNIKIALRWWQKNRQKAVKARDLRMQFYLAMEARFMWPAFSLSLFDEYCEHSGWDEERRLARMFTAEIHERAGRLWPARQAYAEAALDAFWDAEPIFGAARCLHLQKHYRNAVDLFEHGFETEQRTWKRKTLMVSNPLAKSVEPYIYYAEGLHELGRYAEAVKAADKVLEALPGLPNMMALRQMAERACREQSKGPKMLPEGKVFELSRNEPLEAPSAPIPLDVLVAWAIQLWKKNMEDGLLVKALQLIDSLPDIALYEEKIRRARDMTISKLEAVEVKAQVRSGAGPGKVNGDASRIEYRTSDGHMAEAIMGKPVVIDGSDLSALLKEGDRLIARAKEAAVVEESMRMEVERFR